MKRKKVGTSKKFTAVLTKEGKWYVPLIDLGCNRLLVQKMEFQRLQEEFFNWWGCQNVC